MRHIQNITSVICALIIGGTLLIDGTVHPASAQIPQTMSYQGVLTDGAGTPVSDGSYNVTFSLYAAASGGTAIWTETQSVQVTGGIFSVILGSDTPLALAFDQPYWLGVSVDGGQEFSPRRELTAAAYSLKARSLASGQAVTSLNTLTDDVTLAAGDNVTITTSNDSITVSSTGGSDTLAWSLTGNAGTTPGTNFLGTTDNEALEIHVNGARAMRLEPDATSPNIIVGYSGNTIVDGAIGATISGGGGEGNTFSRVSDDYGTIGGGSNNIVGDANGISNDRPYATVSGGHLNLATGMLAAVGGGVSNLATGEATTIGGGNQNRASELFATVAGGYYNEAGADGASVGGGRENTAGGVQAVVAGGSRNSATANRSAVGGGQSNSATSSAATVGGGQQNLASEQAATVGGGRLNVASGQYSFVGGGDSDTASGMYSTIGGGQDNNTEGPTSTVSGGASNTTSGSSSTISGGHSNIASGAGATVAGGSFNTASGTASTVMGGDHNSAGGGFSVASGLRANASHLGAFLFADYNEVDFNSATANEFAVRATGGVRLVTGIDGSGNPTAGATLASGSGTWGTLSDRNAKTNFEAVDTDQILERVADLEITSWNYKAQDPSVRHIGPMAQDFYAAFELGTTDKRITTVDADGVSLAAIQALNKKLREKDAQIADLEQRIAQLEAILLEEGGRGK
jgi:hypothetical protein